MGGFGSGRMAWPTKKKVVEQCLILDIFTIAQGIQIAPGSTGTMSWSYDWEVTRDEVRFKLESRSPDLVIVLKYALRDLKSIESVIRLQQTRPQLGGRRWWLTCPLITQQGPCDRRVAKLYLPPGEVHFGCRDCHELTYRSCQTSHKSENWMQRAKEFLLRERHKTQGDPARRHRGK